MFVRSEKKIKDCCHLEGAAGRDKEFGAIVAAVDNDMLKESEKKGQGQRQKMWQSTNRALRG